MISLDPLFLDAAGHNERNHEFADHISLILRQEPVNGVRSQAICFLQENVVAEAQAALNTQSLAEIWAFKVLF